MGNKIITICLMLLVTLVSCKDDAKSKAEADQGTEATAEKTIQLTNYSDANWTSGVGVEFNMFLADNTKENLEIIKTAKELHLYDGTIIKVTGHTVADPFIQINIDGKASDYKTLAGFPNKITVK